MKKNIIYIFICCALISCGKNEINNIQEKELSKSGIVNNNSKLIDTNKKNILSSNSVKIIEGTGFIDNHILLKHFGPLTGSTGRFKISNNNKFGFNFYKNGKYYFNNNGKEYGPYDEVETDYIYDETGNYGFKYTNKGLEYININGKEFGPYETIEGMKINNGNYGFKYTNKGLEYININGKEFGPYEDIFEFDVNGNSHYISYKNSIGFGIEINGKTYGPYKQKINSKISSIGYIFSFSSINQKCEDLNGYQKCESNSYINLNGKEFGPYNYSNVVDLDDKGGYIYVYKIGEKWYQNVNGKTYNYYEFNGGKTYGDKYMFTYKDIKGNFININGKEFGPYDLISAFETPNKWYFDGNMYGFGYKLGNQYFININGKEFGPYDKLIDYKEYIKFSGNIFAFIYENKQKQYININGKEFGPLYLIDQDNSFFSLNKKYVGAIYKKMEGINNYSYYVNINGKEFGPYSTKDGIEFKNIDINTNGIYSLKYSLNNKEYIDIYSSKKIQKRKSK